jgi:predicted HNH restriction endonuclease
VCGLSEWMDKRIPLEIDHIDGNSDNNVEQNLRLICPNCHAQTETYKGANAGKGSSRQAMRRKRYAEGKTW